ncbi:MAG: cytochrome b/b6 domain-containing protein [Nitrospirota bacterium]|jgi:formate dehydrogenase subunit gamma
MKNEQTEVQRFDIHFRIQHVVMFTTFLTLSFTGWGLKYAQVDVSHWLIRLFGGPETAGIIHRVAGVTMIADFTYHLVYLAYRKYKGQLRLFRKETTIIPLPKDVKDVVHNFLYFLGVVKTKPQFAKFSYAQKFDYWAVFWGMFIIGFSGFCLAFPIFMSTFFPQAISGWVWQLLAIMHSDEALLAIVFILFWHFYNEHLKPEVFPMSWVWLTGRIPLAELKHKHPLEYELLYKDNKEE